MLIKISFWLHNRGFANALISSKYITTVAQFLLDINTSHWVFLVLDYKCICWSKFCFKSQHPPLCSYVLFTDCLNSMFNWKVMQYHERYKKNFVLFNAQNHRDGTERYYIRSLSLEFCWTLRRNLGRFIYVEEEKLHEN